MGLTGRLTDINLTTGTIQGASCGLLQVRERERQNNPREVMTGEETPLIAACLYVKKDYRGTQALLRSAPGQEATGSSCNRGNTD